MKWKYSSNTNEVLAELRKHLPPFMLPTLELTQQYHKNQNRFQESQLVHVYRVLLSAILEFRITDMSALKALCMHDLIEDTKISDQEILSVSDRETLDLIRWVSSESERIDTDTFLNKIQKSPKKAKMIKLIDRLDNCRAMHAIKHSHGDFVRSYAQKTIDFFLPIAENIDTHLYTKLKHEVEDKR